MKNYFKFNLTGKQLLPVWLVFMVLVAVPYVYVIYNFVAAFENKLIAPKNAIVDAVKFMGISIFAIIIIGFVIYFFIAKMTIENTEYKEERLLFTGKFVQYFSVFFKGILLSIITLGIYFPWFIKNIYTFFAENTSYRSNSFGFLGRGAHLFRIVLLYYIVPLIIVSLLMGVLFGINPDNKILFKAVQQISTIFIAIPFVYLRYKWMMNVKYKEYTIKWDTDFWSSCKMILMQVFLSMITIGIYYPLAIVKLYKYFAEKTVVVSDNNNKNFVYEIEPKEDFLFIWGQVLLTIFSLGIYYPWAYCKVLGRILNKTYLVEVAISE